MQSVAKCIAVILLIQLVAASGDVDVESGYAVFKHWYDTYPTGGTEGVGQHTASYMTNFKTIPYAYIEKLIQSIEAEPVVGKSKTKTKSTISFVLL